MKTFNKMWHHLAVADVLNTTKANTTEGLNTDTVNKRLEEHGTNTLSTKGGEKWYILFLKQFHQPLVYILLVASAVVGFMGEWPELIAIMLVVLINAVLGFVQESKAQKAIESLSSVGKQQATVIRNGQKEQINAEKLVPGDTVLLQSGDRVPADLRLVKVRELQIDEASLTGESVPVSKQTEHLPVETTLGDRTNMAYSSSLVTYGSALGVVVNTGDNTEIGKINELISSADVLETPLTRKITKFSHILLWVILGLAAITFVVGLIRGLPLSVIFMEAVALAVGAIPEGLPAVVTITLAIGVSRMASRQAIIRKLPAVETLGSTTVICSDKTGTLTQNQMTVQQIYAGSSTFAVSGTGYKPSGSFTLNNTDIVLNEHPILAEVLQAGVLCNESKLIHEENDWRVEGDPTEGALLVSAQKTNITSEVLAKSYPRLDIIPFESAYQYMATLHSHNGQSISYIKGSIERLLPASNTALNEKGEVVSIERERIVEIAENLAAQGLRVLAFARKSFAGNKNSIEHEDINSDLTFLGLQAMIDPPRPEAIEAVHTSKSAGIIVKMITGDHVKTATAIAEQLGIIDSASKGTQKQGITGIELERLTKEEMRVAASEYNVFARVNPAQKLELVKHLQAEGHTVAMTGDGVNDAPALRQSDIGVAMGITGTDVTKETADMVLTDDNFASIEAAVEEGRGVYDNLIKFITWTLPTNMTEGGVILIAAIMGITLPFMPLQLLWINMTTSIFLGATLAMEKKEPDIMSRPPFPSDSALIGRSGVRKIIIKSILLIIAVFGVFQYLLSTGRGIDVARTGAVNMIVFGEIFYLLASRSLRYSAFKIGFFSNMYLIAGILIMTGLQLAITYVVPMNIVFETSPLNLVDWSLIIGISVLLYALMELDKIRTRRKEETQTVI